MRRFPSCANTSNSSRRRTERQEARIISAETGFMPPWQLGALRLAGMQATGGLRAPLRTSSPGRGVRARFPLSRWCFREARAQTAQDAKRAASSYARGVATQLDTQFVVLQFAAASLRESSPICRVARSGSCHPAPLNPVTPSTPSDATVPPCSTARLSTPTGPLARTPSSRSLCCRSIRLRHCPAARRISWPSSVGTSRDRSRVTVRKSSQGNAGPPQVSLTPTGGGSASRPWGRSKRSIARSATRLPKFRAGKPL